MNLDPRQTVLIQTPVGKGLAPWQDGEKPNAAGSLNESARRLVAALPQDIKGTSPLGNSQVAPVAKLQDAKLSGPNQLKELSAKSNVASNLAKWRDNLMVPKPPPSNVRKMAVGISGGAIAGVLVCVLALHFMRNSAAHRGPGPISPGHDVIQAIPTTDVKAQETAGEKSAGEAYTGSGNVPAGEGHGVLPSASPPAARSKLRLSPEVLFRLELSLEQADRIRRILDRHRKNLPFAEEQIRELLTEEQDRQWQAIAP